MCSIYFRASAAFSLGLERAGGFRTVAFCEIEPFPRKVLAKHWPKVPCYEDVRTLTADILRRDGIGPINVITGGFPCQDLSVAGKQAGMGEGTRSGLWSEIVRLVGELRPDYVIVENVAALLRGPSEQPGRWFGRVLGDLAECGYDAEWENIPASALGAPHRRERVWLAAYPGGKRPASVLNETKLIAQERGDQWPSTEPSRGNLRKFYSLVVWPGNLRMGDGLPEQMDGRIKACGNSVIPQIPELIGRAIMTAATLTATQTVCARSALQRGHRA